MGLTVKLEGRQRLAQSLTSKANAVEAEVHREVADTAEDLLSLSLPVTPMAHDGGQLRESGYADTSTPGTAEVGYTAPHAIYAHEMGITVYPERSPINWTTVGTGTKYLERPLLENRSRYIRNFREAVRRGIKRG